jgi:hypothetical protein
LLLAQVFRIADGRDGGVEIAGDFVADVLGGVFVFLVFFNYDLADREVGVLEAEVGDAVGAEILVRRAGRALLDWTGKSARPHTIRARS